MFRWVLILTCSGLLLAACASAPPSQPVAAAPARALALEPQTALAYHVFTGELALQRGEQRTAAQQYAKAAMLSPDPELAAHAAMVAYRAGDDPLALDLSRRWLELAPGDNAALHLEAVLNTRLGHTQAAVGELQQLLGTKPADQFVLIGEMLEQESSARRSLPVMQELVAEYPDLAEAHYALAHLALQSQRADLAVSESRLALKLRPQWNAAVVLESDALLTQGQGDAALELLRAHRKLAPGDLDLHLAYAAALAQLGNTSQAQTEFVAILKRAPHDPDALYSLGLLALQDKKPDVAQTYFQRLLATEQRNNEAFYFLGDSAEISGRDAEALKWYQQVDGGHYWFPAQIATARVLLAEHKAQEAREYLDALVAADRDDGAQFRLEEAQLFSSAGDMQGALAIFEQGLAEYPGNADLLYGRALLQESSGHVTAAEQDLRAILARRPDDADALNALGYILAVHSTRYQEAREYIEKALRLKPDDPAIMDSLGWVEFQLGDRGRAVSELRRAYARSSDPQIAAHLTEALWAAGEKQEARDVYSRALAQHPGNAALVELNSRIFQ